MGSAGKNVEAEIESHMVHVRSILEQFLLKLPISNKENEELLKIVYSMMNFKKAQIDKIQGTREGSTTEQIEKKVKTGLFSKFGRNKNK
jgi:hypothetical protein